MSGEKVSEKTKTSGCVAVCHQAAHASVCLRVRKILIPIFRDFCDIFNWRESKDMTGFKTYPLLFRNLRSKFYLNVRKIEHVSVMSMQT